MSHSKKSIRLIFAGDMCLGEKDFAVAPELLQTLRSADAVILNLEGPIAADTPAPSGVLRLHSNVRAVGFLKELGVRAVSLANNHILDRGPDLLSETRWRLAENGISFVGAGSDAGEAAAPCFLRIGEMLVGFLGVSQAATKSIPASSQSAGCATLEPARVLADIRALRKEADIVVVCPHWGYTNYEYPLPADRSLGLDMLNAGAHVVAGHHPHVAQGMLCNGAGAVFFSLGNFAFAPFVRGLRPIRWSEANRTSLLGIVELDRSGIVSATCKHVRQHPTEPRLQLLSGRASEKRDGYVSTLSLPLSMPPAEYRAFFRSYARKRFLRRCVRWLNPLHWPNLHPSYLAALPTNLRLLWRQ